MPPRPVTLFLAALFVAIIVSTPSIRNNLLGLFVIEKRLAEGEEICESKVATTDIRPANAVGRSQRSGVINYYLDPARFTDTFVDCVRDKKCRILYHHVGKTGGTTIEERMWKMFPPAIKIPTCCGSDMMKRFEKMMGAYCRAKFSSYQLVGEHFEEVVTDCMDFHRKLEKEGRPRSVVITSFREPIQRCLSSIHQTCNKQLQRRTEQVRKACEACTYDVETDVWDSHVSRTNTHYRQIVRITNLDVDGVHVLSIEMRDIDAFFDSLRGRLEPMGVIVPPSGMRNPERNTHCSFRMPSSMMKALAPSEDVYRNLTLGL